jgi:hypothetical protein
MATCVSEFRGSLLTQLLGRAPRFKKQYVLTIPNSVQFYAFEGFDLGALVSIGGNFIAGTRSSALKRYCCFPVSVL